MALEKGNISTNDTEHDSIHDAAMNKVQTMASIQMTPEMFEKLYLSPQTKTSNDLVRRVGNPTPIALIGFVLATTPLSMDLMKWRGAAGTGAWGTGMILFFGGFMMALGGLFELIIGNTFPAVVFLTFGAWWFGFSATLQPFYNTFGAYSTDPNNPAQGLTSTGFNSGFAFLCISMGLFCLVCLICSLRTNIVFFFIFFTLMMVFLMLAGCYLQISNGDAATAGKLQEAAGAWLFAASGFGWYMFVVVMLASLDFPWSLPVGDLSRLIKSASERREKDAGKDV